MLVPPIATAAIACSARLGEVVVVARAGRRGVDQAGDACGYPGDYERRNHDPVDPYAGQPRGVAVTAGGVAEAPENATREHELEDRRQSDEDEHRVLNGADAVLAEREEGRAVLGDQ